MYTGQILPQLHALFLPWVHPRAYGADLCVVSECFLAEGSSPCIRGRCDQRSGQAIVLRFIPVYTGQMRSISMWLRSGSVHPRVYEADTKFPKSL